MDAKEKKLSFGRYLQTARLEKGITIEQISRETRIRMETLSQIEKEDHKRLPDEVFVKGFLRAFAKAVGANGDEAVKRYLNCRMVMEKIVAADVDLVKSQSGYWRRLIAAIGILAIIITLSIYGVSRFWGEDHTDIPPQPAHVDSGEIVAVNGDPAPLRDVQALDQPGDSALARAGAPNQAHRCSRRDIQRDIIQHQWTARAIPEVHPLQDFIRKIENILVHSWRTGSNDDVIDLLSSNIMMYQFTPFLTAKEGVFFEINRNIIGGNLVFQLNYLKLKFNGDGGSPLAYEMLQGFLPGDNFTWTLQYQQQLANSLQLNLTYNGRKLPDTTALHAGGVQLRAFF